MLNSFIANFVASEVECRECLYQKMRWTQIVNIGRDSLYYFEKHQPDVGFLASQYYHFQGLVCRVSVYERDDANAKRQPYNAINLVVVKYIS